MAKDQSSERYIRRDDRGRFTTIAPRGDSAHAHAAHKRLSENKESGLHIDLPPSIDDQLRQIADAKGLRYDDLSFQLKDGVQALLADALMDLADDAKRPDSDPIAILKGFFVWALAAWAVSRQTPPSAENRNQKIANLRAWISSHDNLPELAPKAFHRKYIYADHD